MATTVKSVDNTAYVDCGTTPAIVTLNGLAGAHIIIDTVLPSATAVGHHLFGDGHQNFQATISGRHVYARAISSANATVVVSN